MPNSPAVSLGVVICTRDRPDQLRAALEAVLESELSAFELIVVDQSAGDDSAQLVRRRAEHDPRIRYVPDSGVGASRARNIGAAVAVGDIIAFTDDDCRPAPSWLGCVAEAMAVKPYRHARNNAVDRTPVPRDRSQTPAGRSRLHRPRSGRVGSSGRVAVRRGLNQAADSRHSVRR